MLFVSSQHPVFTLLIYTLLRLDPVADGLPSNTVYTKAGNIPGPKPAVMNNDSTPGPVSFVLTLQGPDAQVRYLVFLNRSIVNMLLYGELRRFTV